MRFVVSVLAAASLLGMTVAGQSPVHAQKTKKPGHAAHKMAAVKAQYECAHCAVMTAKGGKCPMCGMAMTKLSASKAKTAKFECKHCGVMSAKEGKCPKCKMVMTKMGKPSKS